MDYEQAFQDIYGGEDESYQNYLGAIAQQNETIKSFRGNRVTPITREMWHGLTPTGRAKAQYAVPISPEPSEEGPLGPYQAIQVGPRARAGSVWEQFTTAGKRNLKRVWPITKLFGAAEIPQEGGNYYVEKEKGRAWKQRQQWGIRQSEMALVTGLPTWKAGYSSGEYGIGKQVFQTANTAYTIGGSPGPAGMGYIERNLGRVETYPVKRRYEPTGPYDVVTLIEKAKVGKHYAPGARIQLAEGRGYLPRSQWGQTISKVEEFEGEYGAGVEVTLRRSTAVQNAQYAVKYGGAKAFMSPVSLGGVLTGTEEATLGKSSVQMIAEAKSSVGVIQSFFHQEWQFGNRAAIAQAMGMTERQVSEILAAKGIGGLGLAPYRKWFPSVLERYTKLVARPELIAPEYIEDPTSPYYIHETRILGGRPALERVTVAGQPRYRGNLLSWSMQGPGAIMGSSEYNPRGGKTFLNMEAMVQYIRERPGVAAQDIGQLLYRGARKREAYQGVIKAAAATSSSAPPRAGEFIDLNALEPSRLQELVTEAEQRAANLAHLPPGQSPDVRMVAQQIFKVGAEQFPNLPMRVSTRVGEGELPADVYLPSFKKMGFFSASGKILGEEVGRLPSTFAQVIMGMAGGQQQSTINQLIERTALQQERLATSSNALRLASGTTGGRFLPGRKGLSSLALGSLQTYIPRLLKEGGLLANVFRYPIQQGAFKPSVAMVTQSEQFVREAGLSPGQMYTSLAAGQMAAGDWDADIYNAIISGEALASPSGIFDRYGNPLDLGEVRRLGKLAIQRGAGSIREEMSFTKPLETRQQAQAMFMKPIDELRPLSPAGLAGEFGQGSELYGAEGGYYQKTGRDLMAMYYATGGGRRQLKLTLSALQDIKMGKGEGRYAATLAFHQASHSRAQRPAPLTSAMMTFHNLAGINPETFGYLARETGLPQTIPYGGQELMRAALTNVASMLPEMIGGVPVREGKELVARLTPKEAAALFGPSDRKARGLLETEFTKLKQLAESGTPPTGTALDSIWNVLQSKDVFGGTPQSGWMKKSILGAFYSGRMMGRLGREYFGESYKYPEGVRTKTSGPGASMMRKGQEFDFFRNLTTEQFNAFMEKAGGMPGVWGSQQDVLTAMNLADIQQAYRKITKQGEIPTEMFAQSRDILNQIGAPSGFGLGMYNVRRTAMAGGGWPSEGYQQLEGNLESWGVSPRAGGGPIGRNAYLVGEQGPELYIPYNKRSPSRIVGQRGPEVVGFAEPGYIQPSPATLERRYEGGEVQEFMRALRAAQESGTINARQAATLLNEGLINPTGALDKLSKLRPPVSVVSGERQGGPATGPTQQVGAQSTQLSKEQTEFLAASRPSNLNLYGLGLRSSGDPYSQNIHMARVLGQMLQAESTAFGVTRKIGNVTWGSEGPNASTGGEKIAQGNLLHRLLYENPSLPEEWRGQAGRWGNQPTIGTVPEEIWYPQALGGKIGVRGGSLDLLRLTQDYAFELKAGTQEKAIRSSNVQMSAYYWMSHWAAKEGRMMPTAGGGFTKIQPLTGFRVGGYGHPGSGEEPQAIQSVIDQLRADEAAGRFISPTQELLGHKLLKEEDMIAIFKASDEQRRELLQKGFYQNFGVKSRYGGGDVLPDLTDLDILNQMQGGQAPPAGPPPVVTSLPPVTTAPAQRQFARPGGKYEQLFGTGHFGEYHINKAKAMLESAQRHQATIQRVMGGTGPLTRSERRLIRPMLQLGYGMPAIINLARDQARAGNQAAINWLQTRQPSFGLIPDRDQMSAFMGRLEESDYAQYGMDEKTIQLATSALMGGGQDLNALGMVNPAIAGRVAAINAPFTPEMLNMPANQAMAQAFGGMSQRALGQYRAKVWGLGAAYTKAGAEVPQKLNMLLQGISTAQAAGPRPNQGPAMLQNIQGILDRDWGQIGQGDIQQALTDLNNPDVRKAAREAGIGIRGLAKNLQEVNEGLTPIAKELRGRAKDYLAGQAGTIWEAMQALRGGQPLTGKMAENIARLGAIAQYARQPSGELTGIAGSLAGVIETSAQAQARQNLEDMIAGRMPAAAGRGRGGRGGGAAAAAGGGEGGMADMFGARGIFDKFTFGWTGFRLRQIGWYTYGQPGKWEQQAYPYMEAGMQFGLAMGQTYPSMLQGPLGTMQMQRAQMASMQAGLGMGALQTRLGVQGMFGIPGYDAGLALGRVASPLMYGAGIGLSAGVIGQALGMGALSNPLGLAVGLGVAGIGYAGMLKQAAAPAQVQREAMQIELGQRSGYSFAARAGTTLEMLTRTDNESLGAWAKRFFTTIGEMEMGQTTTESTIESKISAMRGTPEFQIGMADLHIEELGEVQGIGVTEARQVAATLGMAGYTPQDILAGRAGAAYGKLAPMAAVGRAEQMMSAVQQLGSALGIAPGVGLRPYIQAMPTSEAGMMQWLTAANVLRGPLAAVGRTPSITDIQQYAAQAAAGVPQYMTQLQANMQAGMGPLAQAAGVPAPYGNLMETPWWQAQFQPKLGTKTKAMAWNFGAFLPGQPRTLAGRTTTVPTWAPGRLTAEDAAQLAPVVQAMITNPYVYSMMAGGLGGAGAYGEGAAWMMQQGLNIGGMVPGTLAKPTYEYGPGGQGAGIYPVGTMATRGINRQLRTAQYQMQMGLGPWATYGGFQMGMAGNIAQQQEQLATFRQLRPMQEQMAELNLQAQRSNIAYSMAAATMQYRQGLENLGLQQQRWGIQTAFQRQEFGIGFGQFQTQRQWGREDFAYGRQVAGLQYGWQQEDYDRAIRFATGREKQQLIRQRARGEEMFTLETGQRGKQETRQEQAWKWEEERMVRQRRNFEQLAALDTKQFEMQKRHMTESYSLQMGHLAEQLAQLEEQAALQKAMNKITNDQNDREMEWRLAETKQQQDYYEWIHPKELELIKLQEEAAAAQAKQAETQAALYLPGGPIYENFKAWLDYIKSQMPPPQPKPEEYPGKAGPGMALGGAVTGNRSYLVGELGPELFVPRQSGTVLSSATIGDALTGRLGNNISIGNVHINIPPGNYTADEVAKKVKQQFESYINDLAQRQAIRGQPW